MVSSQHCLEALVALGTKPPNLTLLHTDKDANAVMKPFLQLGRDPCRFVPVTTGSNRVTPG